MLTFEKKTFLTAAVMTEDIHTENALFGQEK